MNLVGRYDAALFDLDGVIYLGPLAIPGVPEALAELRECGVKVGFVTNNAARTPKTVATHLQELGIEAEERDVVNSTMALLRMLHRAYPAGATILPVGSGALTQQLQAAGFAVVTTAAEHPDVVVQGYDPQLVWANLEEGVYAIQAGARWFLANPDLTRPTDKGIVPGCGAQAHAIELCVHVSPETAGKPFPPLLEETVLRLDARNPIFVGDRIDTDILGSNNVGMDSLFVFTGAHGKYDLARADEAHRPTTIGWDVAALLAPERIATREGDVVRCGQQRAHLAAGRAVLDTAPQHLQEELDACWALLQLAWSDGADAATEALESLSQLR